MVHQSNKQCASHRDQKVDVEHLIADVLQEVRMLKRVEVRCPYCGFLLFCIYVGAPYVEAKCRKCKQIIVSDCALMASKIKAKRK